jgi:photosystem II stability/assembly factor-like uncharacterized protein
MMIRIMRLGLRRGAALICLGNLMLVSALCAEPVEWREVGPGGGGFLQGFAFDPAEPNRVYVTSDMNGVFLSDDAGDHWRWSSYGAGVTCGGIAVDPGNANLLYAVGPLGIYQSANRGKTWQLVYTRGNGFQGVNNASFGRLDTIFGSRGELVTVSQAGTVFVCTTVGDLIISRDRGRSWQRIPTGGRSRVRGVAPVDEKRVVAGLYEEGIFVSDDGGSTWRNVFSRPPEKLLALAIHPVQRKTLYALFGQPARVTYSPKYSVQRFPAYLYRSDDGGTNWKSIHEFSNLDLHFSATDDQGKRAMDVSKTGTIIILTHLPIRSGDGGKTWEVSRIEVKEDDDFIYQSSRQTGDGKGTIYADPRVPDRWFMSSMLAAFRSDDDGRTWRYKVNGLREQAYWFVRVNPQNPDIVIASDLDHGLIRSTDGGKTWKNIVVENPYEECDQLRFSPNDPTYRTLYALYAGHFPPVLAKSTDAGATWAIMKRWGEKPEGMMTGLCLIQGEKVPVMFVAETGAGVWKSVDEGKNWELKNKGLPKPEEMTYIQFLEADRRGFLYIGIMSKVSGKGGIFKSTDGGESWSAINQGLGSLGVRRRSFEIDPNNPEVLWVGNGRTVYRSTNGGQTWEPRIEGMFCSAILVEPGNSDVVYVCSYTGGGSGTEEQFTDGIYKSVDGGNYFFNISGELLRTIGTTYRVYDLEYAWRGPGRIWAAPGGGGLLYTVPCSGERRSFR